MCKVLRLYGCIEHRAAHVKSSQADERRRPLTIAYHGLLLRLQGTCAVSNLHVRLQLTAYVVTGPQSSA